MDRIIAQIVIDVRLLTMIYGPIRFGQFIEIKEWDFIFSFHNLKFLSILDTHTSVLKKARSVNLVLYRFVNHSMQS